MIEKKEDAQKITIKKLEKKYQKLFNKVNKQIVKTINKYPEITYIIVSSKDYSCKQLQIIETYYKLIGYTVTEQEPKNIMTTPSINTVTVNTISYSVGNSISVDPIVNNKFYIKW